MKIEGFEPIPMFFEIPNWDYELSDLMWSLSELSGSLYYILFGIGKKEGICQV